MQMEPTTIGFIAIGVGGTIKIIDGLIAIVRMQMNKRNGNGKQRANSEFQTMLEGRFITLMDSKTDENVCEERHKSVDEKFTVIFKKLDDILTAILKGN